MTDIEQELPEGWQKVLDPNTSHYYYCNTAKGITQWTPPCQEPAPSTSTSPHDGQQAEPTGSAHIDTSHDEGWYYRDAYGQLQGPFTQEKLRSWRHLLPMDLIVTYQAAAADDGDAGKVEEAEDGNDAEFSTELAELLGDGDTLADWRKQCGAQGGMAPPAPVWEHWLATRKAAAAAAPSPTSAAAKDTDEQDSKAADSFSSYAEAVIAGLSPDDEAVHIARLAAAAGKSIQDLLDFSWGAGSAAPADAGGGASTAGEAHDVAASGSEAGWYPADPHGAAAGPSGAHPRAGTGWEGYTAARAGHAAAGGEEGDYGGEGTAGGGDEEYSFTANFDPRQRRLVLKQKDPQGPQALYGELSSWVDPAELEKSLQEASRRKGMKLPPNVWKKLKERKMQMKKKAKWLV